MSGQARIRQMTFNETFQSSLVQRNQDKFTVDKSLIKGIKENDVAKIIDKTEERELGDEKEIFDEYGQNEAVLIDARKHYDEVKTRSKLCEQEIDKLRAKRQLLKTDEDKLKALHEERRKEMDMIQNQLEEMTNKMNAALYRKQIYNSLKQNTKYDILVLKKRYFDKDVRLMREKTKIKSLRTEAASKIQLSKRCQEMLTSMEKTVTSKLMERTSKINSVHEVLTKKHYNQIRKEEREKQIEQAMVSAMTDKLPQEKEWNKIFFANLFLKSLLKSRMSHLMEEHSQTEVAFRVIKQQTSIKDADELVERFLNKEQYYGQLLQSISEKEQRLEALKEEKERVEKNYQNILYQSEEMNEEKSQVGQVSEHEFLVIQSLNKELLLIQREKQLIYLWATKFLAAYNNEKSRQSVTRRFKKKEVKEVFLEVLNVLKSFLADLDKQENAEEKVEAAFLSSGLKQTLNEDNAQKNTRIKTLSTYEEGSYDMFEDKDMIYDDLSQIDYLQYNRRAIKKNDMQNRKFRIKTKPY